MKTLIATYLVEREQYLQQITVLDAALKNKEISFSQFEVAFKELYNCYQDAKDAIIDRQREFMQHDNISIENQNKAITAVQMGLEMKEFFMAYIKPNLTPADVEILKDAVATGDLEAYKAVTQSIIMKQLICEYNRGGSHDQTV